MIRHRDREQKQNLSFSRYLFITIITVFSFIIFLFASLLNVLGIVSISWSHFLPLMITLICMAFILLELLYPIYLSTQETSSLERFSLLRSVIPNFLLSLSDKRVSYKKIEGIPPPTDPRIIEQREDIVADVFARLVHSSTTAVVLTGIDGNGKSTLAALVYRYAEKQLQADKGIFSAEPIWLTINDSVTMSDIIGTILELLSKSISNLNGMMPKRQAKMLVEALNSVDKPRLIVLDQFENFLNLQTGHTLASSAGVSEWLDEINSRACQCRLLFTSRIRPQGSRVYSPTYLQEYPVKGLNAAEGAQLLRKLKVQASDEELLTVVERCSGHALSLIHLASLLRRDYSLSLELLLKDSDYDRLWLGKITQTSFAYIYKQQLNEIEQKLLLIFSVFREAVPLDAILPLTGEFGVTEPQKQVQNALDDLISYDLFQVSNGDHYQLHSLVIRYIQDYIDESDEQLLQAAHAKAAQYYLRKAIIACPPAEKRRSIRDVQPLIEAVWHLCQAEQWLEAYHLMKQENIFTDLRRWGGIPILLDLYQKLLPIEKLQLDRSQEAHIYNDLGKIYDNLGKKEEAKKYYKEALTICRMVNDRKGETLTLNNLSGVYSVIGKKKKARKYLEQALSITREVGDLGGEGITLNNLGRIYSILGKKKLASEYLSQALDILKEVRDYRGIGRTLNNLALVYDDLGRSSEAQQYNEQALSLTREIGDRWGEGRVLNSLGRIYENQGQIESAFKCYEQALSIRREVQDHGGEATTVNNLGRIYIMLNQPEIAQRYLEEAVSIFRDLGDRWGEGRACNNLGRIYDMMRKKEFAQIYYEQALRIFREIRDRRGKARVFNSLALLAPDEQKEEALKSLQNALRICREIGDRRGEGWTLHNLGRIYSMLGQREQAQDNFEQAWRVRREVGDRKGEGWALHNIGTLLQEQKHYDVALACFTLAKKIFDDLRSSDSEKVQKEINHLHEEIGEEKFTELLAKVELQAHKLVELVLQNF